MAEHWGGGRKFDDRLLTYCRYRVSVECLVKPLQKNGKIPPCTSIVAGRDYLLN